MTTDAELIAAAVSAGKVTVVPAAKANGAAPVASQTKAATRKPRTVTKKAKADPKPAKAAKRELPKGMISASAIATELGMTPKALRAILRRKMEKPTDGWVFDAKMATKVRGLVKKAA